MKSYPLATEHAEQSALIKKGDVFTRLSVVSMANPPFTRYWMCQCSCGTIIKARKDGLLNGRTRSCGCLLREEASRKSTKHGCAVDGRVASEYTIWSGIKSRCLNPNEPCFYRYGGRGIKVCARWVKSFTAFLADMGPRPSKMHSIDRIDNNGDYEPLNCRWATRAEQYSNRSNSRLITWQGETYCVAQWERKLGFGRGIISGRIRIGWTVEKAFATP